MTIVFQLNDIRESIYQWVSEERRWAPGQTCLGELLYDRFFLRVQTLVQMLTKEGFAENAADVNCHWKSAVAELNSDDLHQMLNSSYANKMVSAYDACSDCWPEEGPARLERFLHSLGGLLQLFSKPRKLRHSEFREPAEWVSIIHAGAKMSKEAKQKDWQRTKAKNPSHFRQDPVRKRRVSISDEMAAYWKIELPEFTEPSKVD